MVVDSQNTPMYVPSDLQGVTIDYKTWILHRRHVHTACTQIHSIGPNKHMPRPWPMENPVPLKPIKSGRCVNLPALAPATEKLNPPNTLPEGTTRSQDVPGGTQMCPTGLWRFPVAPGSGGGGEHDPPQPMRTGHGGSPPHPVATPGAPRKTTHAEQSASPGEDNPGPSSSLSCSSRSEAHPAHWRIGCMVRP